MQYLQFKRSFSDRLEPQCHIRFVQYAAAYHSRSTLNTNFGMIVFALPFPLLRSLQLRRRQIWGLVATFSLGAVTIAMSMVRFATIEVIYAWTNVCRLMQSITL